MKIGKMWTSNIGYIPGWSHGSESQMTGYKAACMLNMFEQEAHVEITIYFSDRELTPADTGYACMIRLAVPIVVQYTRLNTRQDATSLILTIACPE